MLHRIFVVMTRATEQFVMVKLCWGKSAEYCVINLEVDDLKAKE